MENKKVKILITCHKPSDVIHTDVYQPIHVGAALKEDALPGMLRDDRGDNISVLNPMYCELTSQYWAWKNMDLDYYGFCHYRRYFSFSEREYRENTFGTVMEKYLDERTIKCHRLNDQVVYETVEQYDMVITKRYDLKKLAGHFPSTYEQFKAAPLLHTKDFDTIIKIIEEKYPEYADAAHTFASGSISCFCNMYILRKDIFFHYCEWMFDILDQFCRRTDMSKYSTEALRTPGHLSERLFNIFLIHLLKSRPGIRVKELQCVMIEDTDPMDLVIKPACTSRNVAVAFSFSNISVPYFSATLQSLINHTTDENYYDLVLIENDVSTENKRILSEMIKKKENISLRFYNPGRLARRYKFNHLDRVQFENILPFLIQKIFQGYHKLIYIDNSLILCHDIADLYHIDIEGYMLGAVKDVEMQGRINRDDDQAYSYCSDLLKMKDPYHRFDGGVLLFNLEEMRKNRSMSSWLKLAVGPYQEVLNVECEDRVRYLDGQWNFPVSVDKSHIDGVLAYAPDSIQREYKRAYENPWIIQYKGIVRPWDCPTGEKAHIFWNYLKDTDYYEEVLYYMRKEHPKNVTSKDQGSLQKPHIRMINRIMPEGSGRRSALDRVYKIIFQR